MEILLQNRLPVACLAAALATAWFGGLIPSAKRDTPPTVASSSSRPVLEGAGTPADPVMLPRPVLGDAEAARPRVTHNLTADPLIAAWSISLPSPETRHDLFAYSLRMPADTEADEELDLGPDTNGPLVLQGISISGNRALAVVNRRVISPGDSLGAWKVTSINADAVVLDGKKGRRLLTLSRFPSEIRASPPANRGQGEPQPTAATTLRSSSLPGS